MRCREKLVKNRQMKLGNFDFNIFKNSKKNSLDLQYKHHNGTKTWEDFWRKKWGDSKKKKIPWLSKIYL